MQVRVSGGLQAFGLALLLLSTKAPLAAADPCPNVPSASSVDLLICKAQTALSKFDPKFQSLKASDFEIVNGDLKVSVKQGHPTYFDGSPYQNPALQSGFYGPIEVSEKFYGVELLVHYTIFRGNVPLADTEAQERITVLFENTTRFNRLRPRVFNSKPFPIRKDGGFEDMQVLGRFEKPLPKEMVQLIKQELVVDSELIATIYIFRTPREIRLIGYSVPPFPLEDLVPVASAMGPF